MKTQILMSLILAGSMVAVSAQAEEQNQNANTSTVKVSDVQKSEEKKEDIDQEITNARMRSELGSKSQWSFKSSLGYNGGSLQKPFDSIRPNYRASATIESLTALSGNVGVNYRVSKGGNLSFGTGVVIMAPLEGDITKDFQDPRASRKGADVKRTQVSTPYMDYSHGYRAMDMQMISSVTYSHYTEEDQTDYYNLMGNLSVSQTVLADFGDSKWQGGVSLSLDKDIAKGSFSVAGDSRYDYGVGLFPFAEYAFNDDYSFRTVFGYFQFAKYEEQGDLIQMEPYQSVGVGISVTRDIYVYPNVQFTPKDIRSDRTNVAVSANLNLF
ncbi:hypothetical protein [Bdellovibrio bacteriovorus]|uniref:hypothetical protein n=1 Tax=Bdellovibrio bacteriovorus TaxID=959 RepID=UPI0002EAB9C5|nr:hypothetical protein [Bdellovibrio bacteriovorus]